MAAGVQHNPAECPTCRTEFEAYRLVEATYPGIVPTNAMLVEASGLSRRALQIHRKPLIEWGILSPNGVLTGVLLDPPPPQRGDAPFSPRDWLAGLTIVCPTCRRILGEIVSQARGVWRLQISVEQLAEALQLSEWTVRMHLRGGHNVKKVGHSLKSLGLVDFRADGSVVGHDRNGRRIIERRPDICVLAPEEPRAGEALSPGRGWYEGALLYRLRDEAKWFSLEHKQAGWIGNLLSDLVRDGWPEEVLLERLRVTPRSLPLKNPYHFAKARLPKRGERYVRSAYEEARPRCANVSCRVLMAKPTQTGMCRECVAEIEAGVRSAPTEVGDGSVVALSLSTTPDDSDPLLAVQAPLPAREWYALAGPSAPPPF